MPQPDLEGPGRFPRVLLVHNRYQQRGGEDAVFEAEASLLEQHGHSVVRLEFTNDAIPSRRSSLASLGLAASTVWSRHGYERVQNAVRRHRPQIVHFHNTFPLVSPAAYSAAKAEGAAVVQTLHNYRLACPNALFYRDGHPCEDCLGRMIPWPGVLHACYHGSRSQTAVVAAMLAVHRVRHTWQRDVDLYVALTDFSRRKLIHSGLPRERVVVKPNFLESDPGSIGMHGTAMLFVGRLDQAKGVESLLETWSKYQPAAPLRIAGNGPLAAMVERAARDVSNIHYLGYLTRPAILAEMHAARALIFPSVWYESFPVTLVEAFACGLPIIATRIGAVAEIVDDGRTGILVDSNNPSDLAAKVAWAWDHPEELSRIGIEARREYEAKYTAERHGERLSEVYRLALANASRAKVATGR